MVVYVYENGSLKKKKKFRINFQPVNLLIWCNMALDDNTTREIHFCF